MFASWIHRKPALDDALALLKDFDDAPKARKTDNGQDGTIEDALDVQRTDDGSNAGHQKRPPRARAEIVLSLDDNRMENADDEEGAQSEQGTLIVEGHSL